MARPPSPDVRITEALQPAAQIVRYDTSAPAARPPSSLHGVAQALSGLSSELSSWGEKQESIRKEEDAIRGEASFYQNNQTGYAEGVARGDIPANKSPEFIKGYKRAEGSTAGFQLESDIAAAYEKWPGKTVDDPAAFDAWFKDTIRGKVTTNDVSVLRGTLPHIREIQNKFHGRWQRDVTQNTQFAAQASYGALFASTIDAYNREGLQNRTGTDIATLGVTLDDIRDKAISTGMRREQIDKLQVDAITTRAYTTRDPRILELLDRKSATGETLSQTPYGLEQKVKATDTLNSLWKQQAAEERIRLEREDKLASNAAKTRIVETLLKNPEATIADSDLAPVMKLDGNFKLDLLEWRSKIRAGDVAEDPTKVSQLYQDLLAKPDINRLYEAMRSGDVKSKESITQAMTFMKTVQDYQGKGVDILGTGAAKNYLKQIETIGQDSKFAVNRMLGDSILTEGGRKAMNDYRFGMMKWAIDNPNASVLEQEKYAYDLGEKVLQGLGVGGKQGQYTNPVEDLGARARALIQPGGAPPPAAAAPAPAQAPSAPQGNPSAPAAPQQQQGGGLQPWQQRIMQATDAPPLVDSLGLTPEQMQSLESVAKQKGATTQQIIQQMWERRPGASQPPAQAPASPAPDTRTDGPRTLLDLPGGLGQIQLVGLRPENEGLIRDAVSRLNIPGLIGNQQQAAAQPAPADGGGGGQVSARLVARVQNGQFGSLVTQVAQAKGYDASKFAAIVAVESGGQNVRNSLGYSGLTQLNQSEWKQYGNGGDIMDPQSNLEAGLASIMAKEGRFKKEFGRDPSVAELYLMHQQGEAGLRSHISNLDAPAWENMRNTGDGWARRAVWGNIPSDMRGRFDSIDNVSSREFIAVWKAKLEGISYDQALASLQRGTRS